MQHKIDRAHLYKQVWHTPLSKLCTEYKISDVGLRKVLDRHGIPRPPSGYWAMKLENQLKHQRPLPDLGPGQTEEIYFEAFSQSPAPNYDKIKLVQLARQFEYQPNKRMPKIIQDIFTSLSKQKIDKYNVIQKQGVRISPEQMRNAKSAANFISQLAPFIGWKISAKSRIKLDTDKGSYQIEINEKVKRFDNPKYREYRTGDQYFGRAEKWLYRPNGELTLSFDNKKFVITDGQLVDPAKVVSYLLKEDYRRQAAAEERHQEEQIKRQKRRHLGVTKLEEKLQGYAAELFLSSAEQYQKWQIAKDYMNHLETQDASNLGGTLQTFKKALIKISAPNPSQLEELLDKKRTSLEAELEKFVVEGYWPGEPWGWQINRQN